MKISTINVKKIVDVGILFHENKDILCRSNSQIVAPSQSEISDQCNLAPTVTSNISMGN